MRQERKLTVSCPTCGFEFTISPHSGDPTAMWGRRFIGTCINFDKLRALHPFDCADLQAEADHWKELIEATRTKKYQR